MYGIILTTLSLARFVAAKGISAPSAVPEPAADLAGDANHINDVFNANSDDPQLYILVRSYFEQVAEKFKTASGYEDVYAQATAVAALITDNEAARSVLTAGPTPTA